MKTIVPILLISLLATGFYSKPPAPPEACLSPEEQKLYDLIMQYRKTKKLPSIALSAKLTQVAKTHARDLVEHYTFDPANNCNPHSWSKQGNWSACCYTNDHKQAQCMWDKPKEIAGYAGAGYEIAYFSSDGVSAKEGIDGWKASPAHNPLLVNSGVWEQAHWKAIGVALYGTYGLVWFGESADETAPTACP